MRRPISILCALIFLTTNVWQSAVEANNEQLTMEFKLILSEEKGYPVQVVLTNKGKVPVSIKTHDLP